MSSKTPNYDLKVKAILDATKPGEKVCALTGEKWVMNEEEIGWYKKFNVPPSDCHPIARQKISTSFWTGFQWWNQKHPKTGATIITPYHPATGVKVLPDKEWFDQDFSTTFLEDDPKRSVFDNVYELTRKIPMPAGSNIKEPENSVALVSGGDRNSYFVLGCESENSLYCWWSTRLQSSCMIWNSDNVAESYNIANSKNVHNSMFVRESLGVMSSSFCFNCSDVEFCFGATNQLHKKYIFFNEQCSKQEYESHIREVDFSKRSEMQKWLERFYDLVGNKTVWPENLSERTENSTGEYLYDVSDCKDCYSCVKHCSNLYQCQFGVEGSESAFSSPIFSSRCYESTNIFSSSNIQFSYAAYRSQNLEYCYMMYDCEDCFGCVGLHHKRFYIFNKPYAEDEYWRKVDEIKTRILDNGDGGRFFPLWMSPMYFGESGGVNHFGAELAEWSILGGKPFNPESEGAIGDLSLGSPRSSIEIPDSIDDVRDEEWVGKPILDEKAGRRFAFLKPELDYYRRKRLAPPRDHFTGRMINLLHESNLAVFEDTACAKCSTQIQVAKNLKYKNRKVYCSSCYMKYLEGI